MPSNIALNKAVNMATKIVPVSDLRRRTSDVIKAVQDGGQVVYVTQHGRPAVVVVDYEYYEALMAQLEDLSDLASLEASVDEPVRPYDEFLAELGSSGTNE
jgi:prevent-host-death family protein